LIRRFIPFSALVLLLFASGCAPEDTPAGPGPNAPAPILPTGVPGSLPNETPNPFALSGPTSTPPVPEQNYCPGGGAITLPPNEPLAAQVNGQGIPLVLFQRQAAQAQAAFVQQGLDPKSQQGQEQIKALQQQVLEQLISDVLVEQAALKEGVQVGEYDVNARIQGLINDAGGRPKFDEYLKTNQLLLSDLCTQIRAQIFGDAMLGRITAASSSQVEQVHAAQILLSNQGDAAKVLQALKQGQDFSALAKQYSQDVATKDNGGDLGWFPRGVMDPQFEAIAFQLQPGQISDVVTTPYGFHIIKVLEKSAARELPPELLQMQRQQVFLNWLDQQRQSAKIERSVK
jgi:foldase protein PrsA